jgi:hypothetical protein
MGMLAPLGRQGAQVAAQPLPMPPHVAKPPQAAGLGSLTLQTPPPSPLAGNLLPGSARTATAPVLPQVVPPPDDASILRNPTHPSFPAVFLARTRNADARTIVSTVQPLCEIMKTKDEQTLGPIIRSVLVLLTENPSTLQHVARTHFFYLLPTSKDALVDTSIACVRMLFDYSPEFLNQYIVRVLSGLIQRKTVPMLIAFQGYVKAFPTFKTICWEVADLLIQMQSLVVNNTDGQLLLALLFQLVKTSEEYLRNRGSYVIQMFLAFLRSEIPGNVIAAYHGLASMYKLKPIYKPEDFPVVMTHLQSGLYCRAALTLLTFLREFPISPELVYLLFERARSTRVAASVLLRMAASPLGCVQIIAFREHLCQLARLWPDETFRIVLLAFRRPEYRALFATDPSFPELLTIFAGTKDSLLFAALSRIFQFLTFDEEFVYELGDAGFLRSLNEGVIAKDLTAVKTVLYIVAKIAHVAFIRDLIPAQRLLLEYVGGQLTPRLLPMYRECAKHWECIEDMRSSGLREALARVKDPELSRAVKELVQLLDVTPLSPSDSA